MQENYKKKNQMQRQGFNNNNNNNKTKQKQTNKKLAMDGLVRSNQIVFDNRFELM